MSNTKYITGNPGGQESLIARISPRSILRGYQVIKRSLETGKWNKNGRQFKDLRSLTSYVTQNPHNLKFIIANPHIRERLDDEIMYRKSIRLNHETYKGIDNLDLSIKE